MPSFRVIFFHSTVTDYIPTNLITIQHFTARDSIGLGAISQGKESATLLSPWNIADKQAKATP